MLRNEAAPGTCRSRNLGSRPEYGPPSLSKMVGAYIYIYIYTYIYMYIYIYDYAYIHMCTHMLGMDMGYLWGCCNLSRP